MASRGSKGTTPTRGHPTNMPPIHNEVNRITRLHTHMGSRESESAFHSDNVINRNTRLHTHIGSKDNDSTTPTRGHPTNMPPTQYDAEEELELSCTESSDDTRHNMSSKSNYRDIDSDEYDALIERQLAEMVDIDPLSTPDAPMERTQGTRGNHIEASQGTLGHSSFRQPPPTKISQVNYRPPNTVPQLARSVRGMNARRLHSLVSAAVQSSNATSAPAYQVDPLVLYPQLKATYTGDPDKAALFLHYLADEMEVCPHDSSKKLITWGTPSQAV